MAPLYFQYNLPANPIPVVKAASIGSRSQLPQPPTARIKLGDFAYGAQVGPWAFVLHFYRFRL